MRISCADPHGSKIDDCGGIEDRMRISCADPHGFKMVDCGAIGMTMKSAKQTRGRGGLRKHRVWDED